MPPRRRTEPDPRPRTMRELLDSLSNIEPERVMRTHISPDYQNEMYMPYLSLTNMMVNQMAQDFATSKLDIKLINDREHTPRLIHAAQRAAEAQRFR